MRSSTYTAAVVLAFTGISLAHRHADAHARLHAKRQVVQETPDGTPYVPAGGNNNWEADYAAKLKANPEPWQAEFAKTYGQPPAAAATAATTTLKKVPLTYDNFKAATPNKKKHHKHKKPKKQGTGTGTGAGNGNGNAPVTTPAPVYGGDGSGGKPGKQGKAPDGGEGALTINIENRMGRALSMLYVSNAGAPGAIGNPSPSATLSSTEPTGITFPQNWAGQITLGDDFQSCGSKLEGSNTPPQIGFIDVSYVDGYSVPIVCSCGDQPEQPVTGCNVELDIEANCPASDKVGKACLNPSISNEWGPTPPFFKDCEAAAYTFSKDDAATCGCPNSRVFNCCVGTRCSERSAASLKGGACQGSLKKRIPSPFG